MRTGCFLLLLFMSFHLGAQTDTVNDVYQKETVTREQYQAMIAKAVISGTIRDRHSGELLPFALVYVLEPNLGIGTTSDINGKYSIALPSGGSYLLAVRMIGYETEVVPVTIEDGKRDSLPISLCESPLSVVVTISIHDDPPDSAVQIIRGGLPAYFDPVSTSSWIIAKPVATPPTDSFTITALRHGSRDRNAAQLLSTGKLYRYNDSLFYFKTESCPAYRYYHKRGNFLLAAEWSGTTPAQFAFRKKRHGWKISSGGVTANVRS